jgi:hypothetical protein
MDFFKRERDVCQRGKMRKQVERLEHDTDGAAVLLQRGCFKNNALTVDLDYALFGILQSGDNAQQR